MTLSTAKIEPSDLVKSFMGVIDKEIEQAIDDELVLVAERIKLRKAEIVSGVMLHIHKLIRVETMGEDVTVIIKNAL